MAWIQKTPGTTPPVYDETTGLTYAGMPDAEMPPETIEDAFNKPFWPAEQPAQPANAEAANAAQAANAEQQAKKEVEKVGGGNQEEYFS